MKVLFVCSANSGIISPIVQAQANSLTKSGLSVEIAPIKGKGALGYLSNVGRLRKEIRTSKPDLIHAHYSFCGIVAALASPKPVVTSLMGSDVINSGVWRSIILIFTRFIWAATIVKSDEMKKRVGCRKIVVIPNGVDLDLFRPLDQEQCRSEIGWSSPKRIALFAADPTRMEKNYALASSAIDNMDREDIDLKVVHGVPQTMLPLYYNASDVILLTSRWEGSPNVVKEAMACNVKVVATDVGDVRYLFGGSKGYYLSSDTPVDVGNNIINALQATDLPEGRDRILRLKMDSESIAQMLNILYQALIKRKTELSHQ